MIQSSLVPRLFLVGGVRKGRGRKGLVNNSTLAWSHGCIPPSALMKENTNVK